MKNNPYHIVGVDVSKAHVDIYWNNKVHRVNNNESELTQWIQKRTFDVDNTLWVIEATGGHERRLFRVLQPLGHLIHQADGTKVCFFKRSRGIHAKTDAIDAQALHAYGETLYPQDIRPPLSSEQAHLQELLGRVQQLRKMKEAELRRREDYLGDMTRVSIEENIEHLNVQIKKFEDELEGLLKGDAELSSKRKLLLTVPGFGEITSRMFLIRLTELGKLKASAICALIGVAPMTKESGIRKRRGHIQHGRDQVRYPLYMGALSILRDDNPFSSYFKHLTGRGKAKKVAVVAVMRKMVVVACAVLEKKEPYCAEKVGVNACKRTT